MKSAVLFFFLALSAAAQYVTVTGSHLANSNGTPITGTIHFLPTASNGTPLGYRLPTQGQVTLQEVSTPVLHGSFSMQVADTTKTQPANVCYRVWATTATGAVILGSSSGGVSSGYNCVQVSPTWCNAGSCNFDNFPPNYIPIALVANPWISSISVRHVFSGAGTYNYAHNLNSLTPLQTCYVNSGSSTYSASPLDANTVAVTTNGPADITCAFGTTPAAVLQNSADFSLSASAATAMQSSAKTIPVTFTAAGSYSHSISASVSGLPSGVTSAFVPTSVSPSVAAPVQISNLTLTPSSASAVGTSSFTVTGNDGTNTHTVTVPLTIIGGPQQQWLLNEGSGTSFAESSGHANTLTGANLTFTNAAPGISYFVPVFDGSTSYMDAANQTYTNFTGSTAFSVSIWVTFADNITTSTFISTLDVTNNYVGWEFSRQSDGSITALLVNSYPSNAIEKHWLSLSFSPGIPYHLVLTYDGSRSAAGLQLYINGAVWSTVSVANNSLTGSMANTQKARLGGRPGQTPNAHGMITDLRILPRALALSDVLFLYSQGPQ